MSNDIDSTQQVNGQWNQSAREGFIRTLWELHAERSSHNGSLNRTDSSFDLLLYIIDPCNIYQTIGACLLGLFIHASFFSDAVDADAILDVTRQYAADADAILDVTVSYMQLLLMQFWM